MRFGVIALNCASLKTAARPVPGGGWGGLGGGGGGGGGGAEPMGRGRQCCALVPLQGQSCTLVPSAVPAPLTSRHLFEPGLTRRDTSPPRSSTRQFCDDVPLQDH